MLIGIEFKRKKIHDLETNRSIWYWRIAPFSSGFNVERAWLWSIAIVGMVVFVIAKIMEAVG